MKLKLCFLGGCEFQYIIAELKSNQHTYFDFDYFHTFEHCAETNPFKFLAEHSDVITNFRLI